MVAKRKTRKSDRAVVEAVSVRDDKVICPCGAVFEIGPNPEGTPVLKVGKVAHLPQLVAIICPNCGAEVRFDRFLKDFTFREN